MHNRIINFYKNISPERKKLFVFLLNILAAIIFYIFFHNAVFSIFLTACIFFIMSAVFNAADEKRLEVLHGQLIEFAINMIIMVRAGKSVRSIIKDSAAWTKPPLKSYTRYLADELEISLSFNEAMDNFADRCSSREARLISTALKLNNRIGGDLIFMMGNIVETLQESFKVRSASRSITLQSRYSGNIISFMPVAVLVALFFFMNESMSDFFASRTGNICLLAGAILETCGIFVTGRILREPRDNSSRHEYTGFKRRKPGMLPVPGLKKMLLCILNKTGGFFENLMKKGKIYKYKELYCSAAGKAKPGTDYRTLIGLKFILAAVFMAVSLILIKNYYYALITAITAGITGIFVPDILFKRMAASRSEDFTRDLPYVIDLLYISAMSGQNIYNCLKILVENHKSIATSEISVFINEINSGIGRLEAFNNITSRNNVENFRNLIFLILQAEKYGSSINEIFRQKSKYLRFEMSQKTETRARKASILLLFPLAFLILPAFVMLVGAPLIFTLSGSFLLI